MLGLQPQSHIAHHAIRCGRALSSAGIATFVAAVLALHWLRPDLNPQVHTVSEYSIGSYGWLMRAAFVALGLGVLATSLSLELRFGLSRWRRAGLLLLVGTALGLFLDAGYNTDHLRVAETISGTVHGVGTLIMGLTLPAAAFILGSDFASVSLPRARWLQVLAIAQCGAIFVFVTGPISGHGLAERISIAMAVATLALMQSFVTSAATASDHPRLHLGRIEVPSRLSAPEGSSIETTCSPEDLPG